MVEVKKFDEEYDGILIKSNDLAIQYYKKSNYGFLRGVPFYFTLNKQDLKNLKEILDKLFEEI